MEHALKEDVMAPTKEKDASKKDASAEKDASPKAQFPRDPNRAAEAGFTYGEAAPEKPGKRMKTPDRISQTVPPDVARESRKEAQQAQAKRSKEAALTEKLEDEAEKIGPRGNFDEGNSGKKGDAKR